MTKHYKNEAAFQKDVMQFLKSQPNAFAVKYWAGNQFTVNGIPDILACINGQFHGIELKTNTGIVRGIQKERMNQIREAGGYAYVLRPKDFQNWKLRWFDAI
ncbi:VRR-NUC domain-containing protein [Staphylococcus aureus]|uniref:VRR-NUC domain-containing protein n=1 Tax=Staphylococcus aureus TaxID=1280 RepID=UPI000E07BCBF|nr:VRR-NUC domain-containing protein [Staphylococcus aureus]MCC5353996.1 VRR-NUC domain-containing protein [Staphylococcus aureus]MCL9696218.1 nuclease [Staphylococcus aureus]MCO4433731.1 nuclease [Staphylococcus aureus]MDF3342579.1 VRR-NUC domain-containing protein [Staphylococcus aureus]NGA99252.1 VRR-NUC domain-containing protein [Staphylococcus aureus]